MQHKAILLLLSLVANQTLIFAQWPKDITAKNGAVITIYQPQPESINGNIIDGRAAFSVVDKKDAEPVFGVFWYSSTMSTDRDSRMVTLESIKIDDVKLPGIQDTAKIGKLKLLLQKEIPLWNLSSSLDDITATIEQEQAIKSENLKNDPPVIFYKTEPTTLVLIDGEPKLQDDKDLKMKRVMNTAFLIVQNPDDKKYYLYGGQFWYASASLTDDYQPVTKLTKSISAIGEQIKKQQTEKPQKSEGGPPSILVSTKTAELIQSKGQAEFKNITGTNLLYVANSDNDIFKNINDQQYYVLLSGRGYFAPKLDGAWLYIASDIKRGQGDRNPSVSTRDQKPSNRGQATQRPTQQPAGQRPSQPQAGKQPAQGNRRNDVYSDKSGNVYQRNNDGSWKQRDGNGWNQTNQSSQMNRDYENRQRSSQRNSDFEQMNRGGNMGGNRSAAGGARMGGGEVEEGNLFQKIGISHKIGARSLS